VDMKQIERAVPAPWRRRRRVRRATWHGRSALVARRHDAIVLSVPGPEAGFGICISGRDVDWLGAVLFEVKIPKDQRKRIRFDEFSTETHDFLEPDRGAFRFVGGIPPAWIRPTPLRIDRSHSLIPNLSLASHRPGLTAVINGWQPRASITRSRLGTPTRARGCRFSVIPLELIPRTILSEACENLSLNGGAETPDRDLLEEGCFLLIEKA